MRKSFVFAVDFDGTIVTHEYPKVGKDVGAIPVLKQLIQNGHRIILWTMRSGETLDDAVKYVEEQGVELFGVNQNPEQISWTTSPKCYANIYIDDAAIGVPLKIYDDSIRDRKFPVVDWEVIETFFKSKNIIVDVITRKEGEK